MPESSVKPLLTCSFCGKNQEEVRKLVSGPRVYICDECIDLCNDIVGDDRGREEPEQPSQWTVSPSSRCLACRLPKLATELLPVPDAGFICHPCADAIRVVADTNLPPLADGQLVNTKDGPAIYDSPSCERPCALCGLVLPAASVLTIPNRGALCPACLAVVAIATSSPPS
jgi:hypothetical protein